VYTALRRHRFAGDVLKDVSLTAV